MLDASIYRKKKYCSTCPFLDNGKAMFLEEGRVDEIKNTLLKSDMESFNCHKTVYNLDENLELTDEQPLKMCYGAYQFLKSKGRANIQMKLKNNS